MKLHIILFLSLFSLPCIAMDAPESANNQPKVQEESNQSPAEELLTMLGKVIEMEKEDPISDANVQKLEMMSEALSVFHNHLEQKGICLCPIFNVINTHIGDALGYPVESGSDSDSDSDSSNLHAQLHKKTEKN